jgi:hypothetical protein
MDPISIGLGLAGLGMQLFGGAAAADNAKQQATVSAGVAADEQQVNVQKQQQMQLEASRNVTENFRNTQKIQAQGMATATAGGAQFGSGIAGAQAGEADQGFFNAQGVNQNLQIGQNIFGITSDINTKKGQLATLGGQAATDQGIASLGGALVKSGPMIGSFAKNIGSGFGNVGNSFFGGGSPSGYGA